MVSTEEPQWHGEVLQSRVPLYFFFPRSSLFLHDDFRFEPLPLFLSRHWLVAVFFSSRKPTLLHPVTNFLVTSLQDQRRSLRLPPPDQDTSSCTREQHSGSKVRADWWINGRYFQAGMGHSPVFLCAASMQESSVAVVLPQKPEERQETVRLIPPTAEKVEVIKVRHLLLAFARPHVHFPL